MELSRVEIIASEAKIGELKDSLSRFGITGMTVTEVEGCGVQSGIEEIFRGVKKTVHLIPKIKVEIVVCTVPVDDVIAVAKKVLHTGEIGDGKIFVSEIQKVVRIRTGDEDKEALRNSDDE